MQARPQRSTTPSVIPWHASDNHAAPLHNGPSDSAFLSVVALVVHTQYSGTQQDLSRFRTLEGHFYQQLVGRTDCTATHTWLRVRPHSSHSRELGAHLPPSNLCQALPDNLGLLHETSQCYPPLSYRLTGQQREAPDLFRTVLSCRLPPCWRVLGILQNGYLDSAIISSVFPVTSR